MSIHPKLQMSHSQHLVMTPQLLQAIKLLQLSAIELNDFVEDEIERNPLLNHEEGGEPLPTGASQNETAAAPADTNILHSNTTNEPQDNEILLSDNTAFEASASLDASSEDLYPETSVIDLPTPRSELDASNFFSQGNSRGGSFDVDDFDSTGMLAAEPTLKEHLSNQLMMLPLGNTERIIAQILIGTVDEAGYLTESVHAISERLGTATQEIEGVLEKLRAFEPTGVFARTLAECLSLQLAERGELTPSYEAFLVNLPLVARHDILGLTRACGVPRKVISEMTFRIRRLNPKPGLQFSCEPVRPVVPDVTVRATPDGSWMVELNSATLPRILVNQTYYAEVSKHVLKGKEKSYLSECLTNANWLVKNLDQRARTILKVTQEIVRQQDAFLVLGIQYLKPLNMKTVADAIEVHESTVSRVTTNKHMATSRGIFELKYFFTAAIPTSNGSAMVSAETVRYRIREMISHETNAKILSDDQLVVLLRETGIEIARRTVAKYREGMNIPSSVQRRRMKNT